MKCIFCVSNADGLLQLHQDFTTYEQHSSVCVWDVRLQPHLCLHSKCLYEPLTSVALIHCVQPVNVFLKELSPVHDFISAVSSLNLRGRASDMWCMRLPASRLT